jgi:hypothetical protein
MTRDPSPSARGAIPPLRLRVLCVKFSNRRSWGPVYLAYQVLNKIDVVVAGKSDDELMAVLGN